MPSKMVGKKVHWSRVFKNYFHRQLPMVWLMCCRAKSKHKSPLACKTDGGNQLLLNFCLKYPNLLTIQQLVTRQRYFIAGSVVPGAGAFEVGVSAALTELKKTVKGRARLGVQVRRKLENKVFLIQTFIVQLTFTVTDIFMTMICSSWYQE